MCTEVNSAMGLQAAAATKRKHEINFGAKDANTYTNCPPPLKTGKWSINNNNYIEAIEEHLNGNNSKDIASNSNKATLAELGVAKCPVSSSCNSACTSSSSAISNINNNNSLNNSINHNGKDVSKAAELTTLTTSPLSLSSTLTVIGGSSTSTSLIPMGSMDGMVSATTPLPPISNTPVPEDSIAKLEEVAAVPCCEPWTAASPEPVDCISKLQAVAVPSDPWGSISTRSTLATTLLSADELDDDDDDFEDDYEEEESIIPTYCPLRYHPFSPAAPAATPSSPHQPPRLGSYGPATHSYGSRPNYYSEPFPQQNCSRTGSPQHMRMPGGNSFPQWQSSGPPAAAGGQQFYVPPEAAYPPQQPPPQQQQQTIRCAENGKSYLELGCSSPTPSVSSVVTASAIVPPPPFVNLHVAAANLDARHPLKRCCDGRGTWCNTNKNCYKDVRLKIRNLSMFKLSRFRQVSEQSLYRSVLICNTLKRIDREIEAEAKEMHQVAVAQAAAAQQQHQQYHQHLHPPHHLQHHLAQQQQSVVAPPPHLLVPQQPHTLLHQQHQDYAPVMNCARLANMDYQVQQQQQQQAAHHQQQLFAQRVPPPPPQHYQSQPERLDTPPPYLNLQAQQLQKPNGNNYALSNSNNLSISNSNLSNSNCDAASLAVTSTLHPYDHYPFRESQSGRATPFPCQPVVMNASAPSTPMPSTQIAPTTMSNVTAAAPISTTNAMATTTTVAATAATSTSAAPPLTNTIAISTSADTSDSGYADDDSTRTTAINWSSVLSLSSQSALDPLNNNDLFAILPPALSVTNPATAVPVPVTSATSPAGNDSGSSHITAVSISGTFTTVQTAGSANSSSTTNGHSNNTQCSASGASSSGAFTTSTATFTTLSTISSATHSLTSSYVNSMSSNAAAAAAAASSWEYGFLDMEFGLGTEFTELVPSCKLSSDELFKSSLTPVVAASRYSAVHDNELEQPAHIMVGS